MTRSRRTRKHVLYSNRSAHASVRKFAEAFSNADKAVDLKPTWAKGYYRVSTAHTGLRRYDDAVSAYKKAMAKGNASFTASNYTETIHHFTEAISLALDNHVLYSNRSAHASVRKFAEAFSDTDKAVDIKPDWPKGYYRVGVAHMGLCRYDDAASAFKNGLEIDPNEALKSGLAAASRTRFNSPFDDVFAGSEMWARLESDPTTRAFPQLDDFKNKMLDVQETPTTLNRHLKDPRIMQALGVLLNLKLRLNLDDDADIPDAEMTEEEPEPEDMEVPEEEREARGRKKEAHKEKEKRNAAYKKDFQAAIQHYAKAIELDEKDVSFLTNRATMYLEMGKQPGFRKEEIYIKRIVARARDLVEVHHGSLYVNRIAQNEDFIAERPTYSSNLTIVPRGHVYVLGDNRNKSF